MKGRNEPSAIQRVEFVRRCRDFGFSIDQVRQLVTLADAPGVPCKDVRDLAAEQLQAVRARLKELQALEAEVNALEDILSDVALYARDPVTFQNSSRRLGQARDELEASETRWLELEEMKSALV